MAVALVGSLLAGCSDVAAPAEQLGSPYRTGPWSDEERALARESVQRLREYDEERRLALQDAYADRGLTVTGEPVVVATEVLSVRSFQDDAAEIVLRRCVDHSRVRVSWRGLRVPALPRGPLTELAVVERFENRTWRVGPVEATTEPCAGRTDDPVPLNG